MKNTIQCLLIDDDVDDQETFSMCVQKIGEYINCLTVDSGVEAIAMLTSKKEYTPHFIFLDVNMPKMNGVECLRHLKKIERLNTTRIFMYSTTTEDALILTCKELGAEDFIVKPSKMAPLRERLSDIFGITEVNKL